MRTSIVRIGNSQGIRIPKVIIEQCHLGPDVELEVENEKLIIRSASFPRQGWEEKFKCMAEEKDDSLIDGEIACQTTWDEDEWQW
ncbi:MAG: AbrB/MazE/SpoVT family DNA-binding domain-containing protein [Deltaproteobacteria bacterium]|nr:AbrB/MazE/SpoVT family DNA-binding domain-containing protein [Deltaproteobacteria bacterium]